jgi:hypothetical protein
MNVAIFAEWLRRQGHQVVRTESSYWYNAGPRVFQAFPYHWLIEPSNRELRNLMLGRGIAALRYSTPLAASTGAVSYHVVLRNPYNLEMLRAQARNGVRRGLSRFQVERIALERLAEEGWSLQADTLERQGRTKSMHQAEWQRICRSADGLPGFEAWGAVCDGELAAALLTARLDDTWCVPYALSHSRFLREHVNNALFFAVSCDLLAREGVQEIFFTLQSLDAPESVDDFKFRMSLVAEPVRQRVILHPCLQPLATRRTHAFVLRRLGRDPGNPFLAKAEGMLRFHMQGKRPLEAQEWPTCLAEYKAKFLGAPDLGAEIEPRAPMLAIPTANTRGSIQHEAA